MRSFMSKLQQFVYPLSEWLTMMLELENSGDTVLEARGDECHAQ